MALGFNYVIFETRGGSTIFIHRDKIVLLRIADSRQYYVQVENNLEYEVKEDQFKIVLKELNINEARWK